MEKTKQNRWLILLIFILIVLVVGLISFIVYKELSDNNNNNVNSNEANDNIIAQQKDMKIVDSKDWIYEADYATNVNQQVYTAWDKTYNVNDYKAPYINIDSEYAETINNEIKKVYDDAMQVFNDGIKDGKSYIDTFKYDYYVNNNILSVVLTTGYGATSVVNLNYHIYNIDITSGMKIDFESILKYKGLSKDDFEAKAKVAIIEEYDAFYKDVDKSDALYSENYDNLKQETLDNYYNNNDKECYIDNNGDINLLTTISYPTDRGYANKLIAVK